MRPGCGRDGHCGEREYFAGYSGRDASGRGRHGTAQGDPPQALFSRDHAYSQDPGHGQDHRTDTWRRRLHHKAVQSVGTDGTCQNTASPLHTLQRGRRSGRGSFGADDPWTHDRQGYPQSQAQRKRAGTDAYGVFHPALSV